MKLTGYKILGLLGLFVLGSATAKAFFVQDAGKAFSYNNIARDGGGNMVVEKDKKVTPPVIIDEEIDYADIADKVLVSPKPFPNIDMSAKSGVKLNMKVGQTVKIELPEPDGSQWKYDLAKNNLKVVSSAVKDGMRILEFEALSPCECKVYLDNYLKKDKQTSVSHSKILRFNVRKK
ncbi:MAG: hypothetical protein E7012_00085 [Alphaproteobacteria bacterium]|nr:hypothetical protein [Alphaproteobacteria bacterium]